MDAKPFGDVATVQRIAKSAEPLQSIHKKLRRRLPLKSLVRAQNAGRGNIQWVLITDVMLDRVKDQGVQLAIQNGGGIHAGRDGGKATRGEVITVLPFQNTLSTFEVSGATLLAALKMVSVK